MEKIKLLIVDDHQMVRLGLSSFMNIQPDIEVVGEAADGESGFLKTEMLDPDVILMDLVMDRLDGIGATQKILAKNPERKILILTSFIDDEKVFPALWFFPYQLILERFYGHLHKYQHHWSVVRNLYIFWHWSHDNFLYPNEHNV